MEERTKTNKSKRTKMKKRTGIELKWQWINEPNKCLKWMSLKEWEQMKEQKKKANEWNKQLNQSEQHKEICKQAAAEVNNTRSFKSLQRKWTWFMCDHRSVSHLWTGEGNAADDARSGESSLGKDQSCSWIISGKQKETLTQRCIETDKTHQSVAL